MNKDSFVLLADVCRDDRESGVTSHETFVRALKPVVEGLLAPG